MKKRLSLLLALLMTLSLCLPAAAQNDAKRVFVDSLGREVMVDQEITRIAVTGALGQITVFAIAGDLFVGLPNAWDEDEKAYLDEKYHDLPELGQVYGGKGAMNLEELLKAAPQVVIDIGEPKEGVAEDMDAMQNQTGIPWVHISAYIESLDQTYALLGELLNRPEKGRELGEYCAKTYASLSALVENVEKVNLLCVLGEKGLNVLAKGSYHSTIIDLMTNNLAVVDNPLSKGTGNEVDMEQILAWNPDVVIFGEGSIYETVAQDPLWQSISAIENNRYYEVPVGPYNWLGMPPSVQRLLGMLWMGKLFYPEQATYDLYTEVAEYYRLFYDYELTQEQYDVLMRNSLGR